MSAIKQPSVIQARLDKAMEAGLVSIGTRFLYTIDGTGKCYEGTLQEKSLEGHVKLENSGVWHWPPDVRIEEILAQPPSVEDLAPAASTGPDLNPPPLPSSPKTVSSAKPTINTTKPKR